MPKVTFLPANITVEFEPGFAESLLDVALSFGIPLEHACGGNCACTTCHVVIRSGEDHVSEMQEDEEDRLFGAAGLTLHSRLGCQCEVKGDLVVEIPSWNRNYAGEAATAPSGRGSV